MRIGRNWRRIRKRRRRYIRVGRRKYRVKRRGRRYKIRIGRRGWKRVKRVKRTRRKRKHSQTYVRGLDFAILAHSGTCKNEINLETKHRRNTTNPKLSMDGQKKADWIR